MSPVVTLAWLGLAVASAWRFRPRSVRARSPKDGGSGTSAALERIDRLGHFVAGRVPVLADLPPRWVAVAVLGVAPATLFVGPSALVIAVIVLGTRRVLARRAAVGVDTRRLEQLSVVSDLLRVALASGLSIGAALGAVSERLPAGTDAGLSGVVVEIERGRSVDEAVAAWGRSSPPAGELAALVRSADRGGTAVVDGLTRLAGELRRRRRRQAEERARRLPITMLVPLVVCVLPSFALLTVVPMVAVGLGRISRLP